MKEKILVALKTKYKNLGFGDKAFEGVADYLTTTITEETNIETGVSGVEILLKSFQGDIDKRVNEAVAKVKQQTTQVQGGEPAKKDEPEGDKIPSWAQALIDSTSQLQKEVNNFKAGSVAISRKQQLESALKESHPTFSAKVLKDFTRMQFANEEDFATYLEETKTDMSAFAQGVADKGLESTQKPIMGAANNAGVSANVQAYIDSKKNESGSLSGKKL